MTQLLLETATDVCSVAIAQAGEILAEHTSADPFQHASHLTLFIRQVAEQAGINLQQLQEVVLSDGPGSYTSLRVGAATAKGLCLALPGLQLRVVPTLSALALATGHTGLVLPTINSRRGQVYGQLYDLGALPQVPGDGESDRSAGYWVNPQNIILTEETWLEDLLEVVGGAAITVTGPGQQRVQEMLPTGAPVQFLAPDTCRATFLLAPAAAPAYSRIVDSATYEPAYLNPPFVTKSKKKPLG
ncbi:tRNA (adenosine(37)-N6)-threonylcarbamoyltransferase complex dimerization subunit type 1 TsaB [Lewinella sp. 4G2]|uniref:tRNA (adenosine(37)-N6)-threonylcarbamoyltransferase complex dimerization subunit type 1 TsaB n=1 Tax=Lewinella sp. 4G2 TaxID=1803372 RepID=UPI0007B48F07|nr:tRNA (adenosine(37)-N6)-threonylcarbamoyltransferase complex dimerization subunit type 1 TsaB [Lewinella sp. 4G2]OAV43026.1 tRNA N6-adenosine(37)-N6-threonylcarbamoyltransferase complex dimerization subunit TsaB [Lewinella sp. 4G2]